MARVVWRSTNRKGTRDRIPFLYLNLRTSYRSRSSVLDFERRAADTAMPSTEVASARVASASIYCPITSPVVGSGVVVDVGVGPPVSGDASARGVLVAGTLLGVSVGTGVDVGGAVVVGTGVFVERTGVDVLVGVFDGAVVGVLLGTSTGVAVSSTGVVGV
jgi:hypothetical protein